MFKKLKKFEHDIPIGRATLIIAAFTLFSRVTGFLRDMLLASKLGLSHEADIYFTSFRIPDLVYNLVILGTLSAAFIPVFSSIYLKDKIEARKVANTILNITAIFMSAVCLFVFIFAEPLTRLIAPGFDAEKISQTAHLTRLMSLSPLIFTVSNVFSSVLISFKKFLIVNTAPLMYNAGIIIGIVYFYPKFGLPGLTYGVLLGAFMHLGIQIPAAVSHGFSWRPVIDLKNSAVKKIASLFLPRVLGLDISYVNLIIVSIVGSTLAAGSIAAFNFANNIQAVALGIFALSVSTATFPNLSELFAKKNYEGYLALLQQSIVRILYFIVPMALMLIVFRAQIVRVLLGYGQCDWSCTINTFDALGILSIGLLTQSLVPLLARAFYAQHNTKTPVYIGLAALIINALLSFLMSKGLGMQGIAIGYVIAITFNATALLTFLQKSVSRLKIDLREPKIISQKVGFKLFVIVASSSVSGLIGYLSLKLFGSFLNTKTVVGIVTQSALSGVCALVTYLIITKQYKLAESERIFSFLAKMTKYLPAK